MLLRRIIHYLSLEAAWGAVGVHHARSHPLVHCDLRNLLLHKYNRKRLKPTPRRQQASSSLALKLRNRHENPPDWIRCSRNHDNYICRSGTAVTIIHFTDVYTSTMHQSVQFRKEFCVC
eukprot:2508126-Pleurochrysis_carterae.AAC.1